MKTQSMLLAALASAPAALAHTAFTNFYVDGVAQVRYKDKMLELVLIMYRETVSLCV